MKKLIKILAVALALSIVVGILGIGCAPQAMPAKLMALYGEPTDSEAFLNHYREVHIPLANQLPDVRNFIISNGTVAAAEGESPYFFIAEVEWDDMDSLQNALASPEMEACAADLPNFATGGVTILTYEYEEVYATQGEMGAMPAKLIALYGEPTDPEAFLNHYREVHIPLANQLPDVKNFIISKGTVAAAEGESPYFFIAEVEWDDMDSLQNALASPEMEACAADLPNFATGGVTILTYEYEEVK